MRSGSAPGGRRHGRRHVGRFGAERPLLTALHPPPQPQATEQPDQDDEAVEAAGRRHHTGHSRAGGADTETEPEDDAAVDVPPFDAVVREREPAGVPSATHPAEYGE